MNGFGLTRQQIEQAAGPSVQPRDAQVFREVLTNAVAGNVLSVRLTKQGQAGTEKAAVVASVTGGMICDVPAM